MTERQRFETLIEYGNEGDCWGYRGATIDGKPVFILDGEPMDAQRLSWALSNRSALGDAVIVPTCPTPTCLNPQHLQAAQFGGA